MSIDPTVALLGAAPEVKLRYLVESCHLATVELRLQLSARDPDLEILRSINESLHGAVGVLQHHCRGQALERWFDVFLLHPISSDVTARLRVQALHALREA